ncbi:hypothetical protein QFC24_000783 [Naganishia onofrii]|uniref:Uncharacterized protein n=1 Tax=Naganishia onofrii TaxID=1851511 RepID=A0ACC2XWH8_9TREE|nr:hypothetical protein QFC24_000783 [Naganishia onofrii]
MREPTALIIVDVQNDFLPPTGSLAVPEGREILPRIHKLLEDDEWAGEWELVVVTQDGKPYTKIRIPGPRPSTAGSGINGTEEDDHSGSSAEDAVKEPKEQGDEGETMIDMFIWPDHCIPGTTGAEIEEGLQRRLKPWFAKNKVAVARKRTDETKVTGPDLGSFLLSKGIKRCVVVGLATDYCVAQTTLSAVSYTTTTADAAGNDGQKAFKTYVYTPATRGVNAGDSERALVDMKKKGAVLLDDEDGLRRVLGF